MSSVKSPVRWADEMGVWPFNALNGRQQSFGRGKRREERFQTNLLTTDFGSVVDISGTGLRIRAASRPKLNKGQELSLKIRSPQCQIAVKCRVVRLVKVKEPGARGVDICVTLTDAKPGLRAALHHLGRFGFIPRLTPSAADAPPPPRPGEKPAPGYTGTDRRIRVGRKMLPDYYEVLGLTTDATADQVRSAYHHLARQHHPDAVSDAEAAEMFSLLTEAYRVLHTPERRRAYDELRESQLRDAA